jgi:hypothetical protein
MLMTTKVPPERLEKYFDTFSKHFLMHESTNAADVEVLTADLGDQFEAEGAHLRGISYDPHGQSVEIQLEGGDHRSYKPSEVWVVEEDDGFVRAIEMVQPDGTRELVRIRRLGVRRSV